MSGPLVFFTTAGIYGVWIFVWRIQKPPRWRKESDPNWISKFRNSPIIGIGNLVCFIGQYSKIVISLFTFRVHNVKSSIGLTSLGFKATVIPRNIFSVSWCTLLLKLSESLRMLTCRSACPPSSRADYRLSKIARSTHVNVLLYLR